MLPEGGPGHQVELPSEVLQHTVTHPALSHIHTQTHMRHPSIAGVGLVRMIARAIITRQQTNVKGAERQARVR